MVKNLTAMCETWVRSLGWEDPWRRKRQSTLVLLPGEFHGKWNLKGYSSWGHKESDTTEQLTLSHFPFSASIRASDTDEVKLRRINRKSSVSPTQSTADKPTFLLALFASLRVQTFDNSGFILFSPMFFIFLSLFFTLELILILK